MIRACTVVGLLGVFVVDSKDALGRPIGASAMWVTPGACGWFVLPADAGAAEALELTRRGRGPAQCGAMMALAELGGGTFEPSNPGALAAALRAINAAARRGGEAEAAAPRAASPSRRRGEVRALAGWLSAEGRALGHEPLERAAAAVATLWDPDGAGPETLAPPRESALRAWASAEETWDAAACLAAERAIDALLGRDDPELRAEGLQVAAFCVGAARATRLGGSAAAEYVGAAERLAASVDGAHRGLRAFLAGR